MTKTDAAAADRILNAACKEAVRQIRAGDTIRPEATLYAATVTAELLIGADA